MLKEIVRTYLCYPCTKESAAAFVGAVLRLTAEERTEAVGAALWSHDHSVAIDQGLHPELYAQCEQDIKVLDDGTLTKLLVAGRNLRDSLDLPAFG